jgi:Trypsin
MRLPFASSSSSSSPSLAASFASFASVTALACAGAAGCSATFDGPTPYEDGPTSRYDAPTPPPRQATPPTPAPTPRVAPTSEGAFSEVVYVFMKDRRNQKWFCTGTLVAADRVVTAAHCLDSMFVSYEIVAPDAPGAPRVPARSPLQQSSAVEDVANPDIGLLTLASPITLGHYAQLTDVSARVDAGEQLSAEAIVRTAEDPEAPLAPSGAMPLSSAVDLGYEHGFATPLFSKGGDSGAGLFLVENGVMTHQLIGVARQPEPSRALDHFTRVDPSFLGWYAEKTGSAD